MVFTLINSNIHRETSDLRLSELIYLIESKDIDLRQVSLKNIHEEGICEEIFDLASSSDLVIYLSVLDSEESQTRLNKYLERYDNESHAPIYLILDANDLLSVETVSQYIDDFESFARDHKSKLIDVKYFKDAIRFFDDLEI